MDVVDSSKKQLKLHEIILDVLKREEKSGDLKDDLAATMLSIIQELNMPDTYVRQFGNSLGIAHVKDGDCMFRILNMDTAPNFLKNAVDFLQYMVDELGVTKAVTTYKKQVLRGFVKAMMKSYNKKNPEAQLTHAILASDFGDDVVVIYSEE